MCFIDNNIQVKIKKYNFLNMNSLEKSNRNSGGSENVKMTGKKKGKNRKNNNIEQQQSQHIKFKENSINGSSNSGEETTKLNNDENHIDIKNCHKENENGCMPEGINGISCEMVRNTTNPINNAENIESNEHRFENNSIIKKNKKIKGKFINDVDVKTVNICKKHDENNENENKNENENCFLNAHENAEINNRSENHDDSKKDVDENHVTCNDSNTSDSNNYCQSSENDIGGETKPNLKTTNNSCSSSSCSPSNLDMSKEIIPNVNAQLTLSSPSSSQSQEQSELANNLDLSNIVIEYKQYESELQMQDIMRLIQAELSEPYSIYTYRYFIYNWPKLCFLASHNNEYVGAIVCKLDIHMHVVKRGYIAMLAVKKEYRKLKIGTNLVQKAIEAMLADDADEVVLETEMKNIPALRLYENLGFVRDKRLFRYYLNGVDALRLKLWFR